MRPKLKHQGRPKDSRVVVYNAG